MIVLRGGVLSLYWDYIVSVHLRRSFVSYCMACFVSKTELLGNLIANPNVESEHGIFWYVRKTFVLADVYYYY